MHYVGEIAVSNKMYDTAVNVKRRGGMVFVTRPELPDSSVAWSTEYRDQMCDNCRGLGKLGLQIIVGGPYETKVPATSWLDGEDGAGPRVTFIDGRWYLQKTQQYTCPICGGSGGRKAAKKDPQAALVL